VPGEAARERIVDRVDAALALVKSIEGHVEAASSRVKNSSRSIAAKAFGGELISTNGVSP